MHDTTVDGVAKKEKQKAEPAALKFPSLVVIPPFYRSVGVPWGPGGRSAGVDINAKRGGR